MNLFINNNILNLFIKNNILNLFIKNNILNLLIKNNILTGAHRDAEGRGAWEALHVTHDQRCSIDVTDLADIFTVGRPRKARNNLKISA